MYKGTVLQYLRKYIKDLQADQLESYVLAGELTLHAIELEPSAISDWVSDMIPYTGEIEKVFCSKVDIKIPWAQLRTKPVQISIQQMEVDLVVHDFREQDWAVHQATEQKSKLIESRMVDLSQAINPEKVLKQLELTWTDYVSAGMQLRIEFLRVNLLTSSASRFPPKTGDHDCPSPAPPVMAGPDPSLAFTIDIEGLFMAPCHHTSGWSVNYVENPDQVYEHDKHRKILKLSRLLTLKSLSVLSRGETPLVTHSPGFRMRLSSEFTCVNLVKTKKKFCIPPFPSSSNKALWMDRLNISSSCSCELAAFYAILQDLLAPVVVPPESLTPGNRPCHYTYKERDILTAETEAQLQLLIDEMRLLQKPLVATADSSLQLPPLPQPKPKKKGIVTGTHDVKKLFAGLAREVKDNANKVTEQAQARTDKIVSSGKKIFSSAFSNLRIQAKVTATSPSASVTMDGKASGKGSVSADQSPASRGRLSSVYSEESEYFTDAVSEGDEEGDASPRAELVAEGHAEAFAMWTSETGAVSDSDFQIQTQLVVLDKVCFDSFFHIHVNEVGIVAACNNVLVSIVMRKVDMTSESQTPLTLAQLSSLAAFSQFPQIFLLHAKNLTKNVLLPSEPVTACTALSALSVSVTVTPPPDSPENHTTVLHMSPRAAGVKALAIKWRSRTPPPSRLLAGPAAVIEAAAKTQPFEGCVHGMTVSTSGWPAVMALYDQVMAWAGDFPDPSFDPVMELRMFLRDSEVVTESGWRVALPSGIVSRNIVKSRISDLLGGLQQLSAIPEIHFSDAVPVEGGDSEQSFPENGGFCACICGQEVCSWSWALPAVGQQNVPIRMKFPNRVIGASGTVSERAWRHALTEKTDSDQHVYVPISDFSALMEAKLRTAELELTVEQLREQYKSVMEEMTKRNIYLKEKWAADAVHATSKESVVDVLTQKVVHLEQYVRELESETLAANRNVSESRSVAAAEIAIAKKAVLEETQILKHKLAEQAVVREAVIDLSAAKDKQIEELRKQLDFMLGLGVKLTANVVTQTNEFDRDS